MSKPRWVLIDGYNLLHASGVFGSAGPTSLHSSREALLDWLGQVLSDAERQRTTIVFDAREAPPGLPADAEKHGIRIQFAPRGCEADDLIEQLIDAHHHPRSLLVVSSDHRLHRAAHRRRGQAIDSERWVAQRQRPTRGQSGDIDRSQLLAPEELQQLRDEFIDKPSPEKPD